MQYYTFRLTPRVKRAISVIEDSKTLNKLSIKQLIQLKADLYGFSDINTEELIERLNTFKRPQLREFNDMSRQEQKIATALMRLNNHARRRMIRIADDYKNKRPTEKKQDIHDLSFVFRNNGRNFHSYPEVTNMNSEVSWYHHQKKFPQQKSFWDKFSNKTIRNTIRIGKAAVLGSYVWLGSWLMSDNKDQIPDEFNFQTSKTEQPVMYKFNQNSKTYHAKASDFKSVNGKKVTKKQNLNSAGLYQFSQKTNNLA